MNKKLIFISVFIIICVGTIYLSVHPVYKTPIWSIGDSITKGDLYDGAYNGYYDTYQYWIDNYSINNISSPYNKGVDGERCYQIATRFNNDIGNDSTVIVMCGINDIGVHGIAGDEKNWTEVIPYIEDIVDKAIIKKNKVILLEILPTEYGNCIDIKGVNNWMNMKYRYNRHVNIVHTNQAFENGTACYANMSLFYDGLHPNVDGNKKLGSMIWDVINR